MKIYTKTGDSGNTSLFDGSRIRKDDVRIQILGEIDELNSFVGLLSSHMPEIEEDEILLNSQRNFLLALQSNFFDLGSEIANPKESSYFDFSSTITLIEENIDTMTEVLVPLSNFILPGGSICGSISHICRAISRRVERSYISFLQDSSYENKSAGIFLNRVSDYFFTLSRYLNKSLEKEDILWEQRKDL